MTSVRLRAFRFLLRFCHQTMAFSSGCDGRVKYRPQKFVKTIAAAQGSRNPDPPASKREDRQDDERNHHHPRTLMNPAMPMPMWRGRPRPRVAMRQIVGGFLMRFRRPAILPKKSHEPQAEHIKGSEKCREQS